MRSRLAIAIILMAAAGCAGGPSGAGGGAAAPTAAPTSAQAGGTTLVAIAPPAAPKMTLPEFLGLKALCGHIGAGAKKLHDCFTDIFPGLKSIPSPDELGPNADPGSQAAAEIQQDEAAAADKAASLMYLASVGCGCYPGVEEAFLSALDDCNEFVRFTAAKELRKIAGKDSCGNCRTGQCCSAALQKKLARLGFEMDDNACPLEPSPRVRRMARLALAGCGGAALVEAGPGAAPTEGPSREDIPPGEPEPAPPEEMSVMRDEQSPSSPVVPASFEVRDVHAGAVLARVNGRPIHEGAVRRLGGPADVQQMTAALAEEIRVQLLCHEARRFWPPHEAAQRSASAVQEGIVGRSKSADQQLAAAWLAAQAAKAIQPSDQELFAHYQAKSKQYWEPESIRWESITIGIAGRVSEAKANAAAEHIRLRLMGAQQPSPNVDLSTAKSKTHGWTKLDSFQPGPLANLLASLPVGKVSPILRSPNGLEIVRVLQRQKPIRTPFENVRESIRSELITAKTPAFADAYVRELHQRSHVWSVFEGMSSAQVRKAVALTSDAVDSTAE